jgi:transposase, IS30 family
MYHQLTEPERYTLGVLRRQGLSTRSIARVLGRNPSSISREIRRNACHATDGAYRPSKAQERTNGRRRRARRARHHDDSVYQAIEGLLCEEQWSPEQIASWLGQNAIARISHMTIYRHVHEDARRGGCLRTSLRQGGKRRRKRTFGPEKRGRLQGKPMIDTRPEAVESRDEPGHWEGDTVIGTVGERDTATWSPINSTNDRENAMATRHRSNDSTSYSECVAFGVLIHPSALGLLNSMRTTARVG